MITAVNDGGREGGSESTRLPLVYFQFPASICVAVPVRVDSGALQRFKLPLL